MLRQLSKTKRAIKGNLGYKTSSVLMETFITLYADEIMKTDKLAMIIRFSILNNFSAHGTVYKPTQDEVKLFHAKLTSQKVQDHYNNLSKEGQLAFLEVSKDNIDMSWDKVKSCPPFLVKVYLNYLVAHHKYLETLAIALYIYVSKGVNISAQRFDKICASLQVPLTHLSHSTVKELIQKLPVLNDHNRVQVLRFLKNLANEDASLKPFTWLVSQAAFPNVSHHILISKFLSTPSLTGMTLWIDLIPAAEFEAYNQQMDTLIQDPFVGFTNPEVPRIRVRHLFSLAVEMLDIIEGDRSSWKAYAPINFSSVPQIAQYAREFKAAISTITSSNSSMGVLRSILGDDVSRNATGEIVTTIGGQSSTSRLVTMTMLKDKERVYLASLNDTNGLKIAVTKARTLLSMTPDLASGDEGHINSLAEFSSYEVNEVDIWKQFGAKDIDGVTDVKDYLPETYLGDNRVKFNNQPQASGGATRKDK
ncbi:putative nucleoprotein [Wenzhou Crab Virus 3]|uniref:Putative nucleoprotein n=1 Tax=Wenzhou Crab Virus 3 TaxID=1608093 RepID=A0A0B5KEP7_9VIRU|nr:putative nucleoprotein [Wenzhou Crab Virus 3]AJG39064.1 putative nucleoprotein [Wenzhou Crab Virus 3]